MCVWRSLRNGTSFGPFGEVEVGDNGHNQRGDSLCGHVLDETGLECSCKDGEDRPMMKRNFHLLMDTGAWTIPNADADAKQLARAEKPMNSP